MIFFLLGVLGTVITGIIADYSLKERWLWYMLAFALLGCVGFFVDTINNI